MTTQTESSREYIKTRTYKASKELLYRMWSNPEHVNHWWGPAGFSTTTHEMEFRTGGLWRFTMHGPDGTDFPNQVRYTLISPDRIEYHHGGPGLMVDFRVSVSFVEKGDETEMTFRMTFPTAEERIRLEQFGAEAGIVSTLERLGEFVSRQDPEARELVIVRKFSAPQELVWKALTEAEQIKQWICPAGLTMESSSDPVAPGGHWASKMITPSGYSMELEGEYLQVEPTSFLKYSHRWKRDDGSYKPTTIVSISLHENDRATTMTFVQSGFWSEEARAAHLGGWSNPIHKLAVLLDSTKDDRTLSFSREFAAPLDLVWRCWTEPDRLASWFAPKPYTVPKCEIDLRPGGTLLLVMRSPEGMEHPMIAELTDVTPGQSLGWVTSVPGFDGELALQGGTMIFFEDLGEKTRVTVHAYMAALSDQGTMMIGGMEQGWNMTLDQMVEVCTSQ